MRRRVDHGAMGIAGFVVPWSLVAPGVASAHLSGEATPAARVLRLDRDGMPEVPWTVTQVRPVAVGEVSLGAWVSLTVPRGDFALGCEVLFTRNPDPRPLACLGPLVLEVSDAGPLRFAGGAEAASAGLPTGRWLRLLFARVGDRVQAEILDGEAVITAVSAPAAGRPERLEIGGDPGEARPTLNARLGRIELSWPGGARGWRFPARGPVSAVAADDGAMLNVHNLPTFAATSPRWNGSSFDPRLTPDHYDAIHLHDDDFGGLDWPATHAVEVPETAAAGVYALEVAGERLPFFVRPARPGARLAFLVPTATYLAYADEALPEARFPWACRDRGQAFAAANGFLSPYDLHSDGSGVCLASLRRPRATLRDDYLYPLCGAPHLLPVDLALLRFAAREGIALDILTDHDLDAEGAAALAPYVGLVTGSHPEYWSGAMLGALEAFLGRGGSLAYLGGNGFDTVVAFDGDVMELRRASVPSHRTWDPAPGEGHLSMTGEPGGPWRARGRGELHLTGVGMSLMGFGPSRPFRRTRESHAPEVSWLFDGVEGETFGEAGRVLGGAAGYEVDATNRRLGTPDGARVLAVAEGFGPEFIDDAGRWFLDEAERARHRRAEMTLRVHPGGGLVFAASSVAWCGALPAPGAANGVGRITANLLRRLAR